MNQIRKILLLMSVLLFSSTLFAQQDGLEFVKDQYPQLSTIFEKELTNTHASYTFAIDVSGTMKKYSDKVQPALKEFVKALPEGDFVRIIRFGTFAKGDENGYLGVVNSNLKKDLLNAIDNLYTNNNDDKEFRAFTDITDMMAKVSASIQKSTNEMNFVFILTDFRNDQKGKGERIFSKEELQDIYKIFDAATFDKEGRIVALQLPVNVEAKGYCLNQLKDEVLNKSRMRYEMQPITTDAALASWFSDLKKEIMVDRLRSIVIKENRVTEMKFETEMDIDGNVKATVNWIPNRLFNCVKIDSSYVVQRENTENIEQSKVIDGFYFMNNTEVFQQTEVTMLELELGKLRHQDWGFHRFNENLQLGVTLPTPYDSEFRKLGIEKPIPDVSTPMDKLVFTFFLPLWLVGVIIGTIIIYLLLVVRSLAINNKARILAEVEIKNRKYERLGKTYFRTKKNIDIPAAVKCISVPDGWNFKLQIVKGNPLIFGKPYIALKNTRGFVGTSTGRPLYSNKFSVGKKNEINVSCGPDKNTLSHIVNIKFSKK